MVLSQKQSQLSRSFLMNVSVNQKVLDPVSTPKGTASTAWTAGEKSFTVSSYIALVQKKCRSVSRHQILEELWWSRIMVLINPFSLAALHFELCASHSILLAHLFGSQVAQNIISKPKKTKHFWLLIQLYSQHILSSHLYYYVHHYFHWKRNTTSTSI